ncbi:AAA domain-containing protein [Halobacteriovorax sp. BALOs_7]|uniref:AAA domain-containing protein n=1 Tax=Halobacteriovorax sp. BALOs_7 TaxID=2109558 RepID=UPI000EA0182C|nr:AAA domain-containing protein [Halobacteriovorax sp. BALOs_7]
MSEKLKEAKRRLAGLMTYIKEVRTRLNTPVFSVAEYDWRQYFKDLPNHPYVEVFKLEEEGDLVLRIKKPKETHCPPLPEELEGWVRPSWRKVSGELYVVESRNFEGEGEDGEVKTVFFNEDESRVKALETWKVKREEWVKAEMPNEQVRKLFARFFELEAKIDKDSDLYQLFLGDGFFKFNHPDIGVIDHPLIFKELSINFITSKDEPVFEISSTDSGTQVNTELLRYIGVNGKHLAEYRQKVENELIDPQEASGTTGFLNTVIHKSWEDGQFFDDENFKHDGPAIYRSQILFLGKKQDRVLDQIDNYISSINDGDKISGVFSNIIGLSDLNSENTDFGSPPPFPGQETSINTQKPKVEYFLTKEANPEQKRIIEVLENKGQVGVQGPPGTGKSHTIANLIGHLLSKGKTILVTSYTSKALNVIRDKVVDELRPLCVSALDNSRESKKQLESSINFIDEMLSRKNIEQLDREINDFKSKKEKLEGEISKLKKQLYEAINSEYREFLIGEKSFLPADASRYLEANKDDGWISGSVKGDLSPIEDQQFITSCKELFSVSFEDQEEILKGLPDSGSLIPPDRFESYRKNFDLNNSQEKITHRKIFASENVEVNLLFETVSLIEDLISKVKNAETWQRDIAENSLRGQENIKIYEEYIETYSERTENFRSRVHLIQKYKPSVDEHSDYKSLITVLENMNEDKTKKAKFSMWTTLFSSELKFLRGNCTVKGKEPKTSDEFKSIEYFIRNVVDRTVLCEEWEHTFGNESLDLQNEKEPELIIDRNIKHIEYWMNFSSELGKVIQKLKELAVKWPTDKHDEIFSNESSDHRYLNTVITELIETIYPGLISMKEKLELVNDNALIQSSIKVLRAESLKSNIAERLRINLDSKNHEEYKSDFKELLRLEVQKRKVDSSNQSLSSLKTQAPVFYQEILDRNIEVSNNISLEKAWLYNRIEFELDKLGESDPDSLQKSIYHKETLLKKLNESYIESLVWRNQLQRNGIAERQALNGWLNLQKKITKSGKGVVDDILKKEARTLLKKCKSAIPVWIMPISRLLDNFTLGQTMFDVIIVDEASQADMTNMISFAFAEKIVVVGDDKQVSPPGIVRDKLGLQSLIDEYLEGIPNKRNYDLKHSLYDIACESFGQPIRLEEHFRCVPEIIQFCNHLSYDGKIKILRESSSNPTPPPVLPLRVQGEVENDINDPEARQIVCLIQAMIEHPSYRDATFGVISLKGQKQHVHIDRLLRERLGEHLYHEKNILCGKAPQFQGDEREVMLLSMVDVAGEGPLRMTNADGDKQKEYNVAVSRAKNQLWVVHSFDIEKDLKQGDIRLRLINHAISPNEIVDQLKIDAQKADSPFEEMVHKDLRQKEVDFVPQYEIGSFRIDIVVFNKHGDRIAIECDGDKYHTSAEAVKNDLERQAILERLGLKFIRIRGSDYFRRKETTMEKVFERLMELEVEFGTKAKSEDTFKDTDISNEIKRKAEEIKVKWEEEESEDEELAS